MTSEEITDYKLLNMLDRIEENVLDATSLDETTSGKLLDAAESLKRDILAGASPWEEKLLEALKNSTVITKGKIDDESDAKDALKTLTDFQSGTQNPGDAPDTPDQPTG